MDYRIRKIVENIKNSRNFSGFATTDESMALHTTMKVGGNAAVFACPENVTSLAFLIFLCNQEEIPFFILGGGSNLVVSDEGFSGVMISMEKFNSIRRSENLVECGAGVLTNDAVDFFCQNGMSGLETFAGLPGTCGGACFMNARCYSKDISSAIHSVEYIEAKKTGLDFPNFLEEGAKTYHNACDDSDWSYKKSPFMGNSRIITKVVFKAEKEGVPAEEIKAKCMDFIRDREQKGHFKFPSSGSVFKNNRDFGFPSGKLIDDAGLKGTKIGGAEVAPWHGNIIINTGNATCSDVKSLVRLIQEKVKERTDCFLECEVIFL